MTSTRLHVQTQSTECGLAAMGMILGYHGRHVSMETLRAVSGVSRDCVNGIDLIRIADHFGLKSRVLRREPDQLSNLGFPLVVYLDFIHFSVVEAIDAQYVLLNDPAFGRYRMPRDRFDDSFTGIAFAFEKTGAFQPGGQHVRLWQRFARQLSFCPRAPILAMLGAGVLGYVALIVAILVPYITSHQSAPPLWTVIGAFLVFALLRFCANRVAARLEDRFIRERLPALAGHILAQPFSFVAYRLPPILTQRIFGQEEFAQRLFRHVMPAAIGAVALGLICCTLFWINGVVGAATSLIVAVGIFVLFLLDRYAAREGREKQDDRDARWSKISHGLENFESFKTSGGDRDFFNGAMGIFADRLEVRQRTGEARILSESLADLMIALLLPVALICLWLTQPADTVLAPETQWSAIAIFGLILALHTPLRAFSDLHGDFGRLQLTLPPLDDLLESEASTRQPGNADSERNCAGTVLAARGAGFGFSAVRPPLLHDIDLSIVPGERVGLTGPSGCGKSTLVALLIGLHRPMSGEVSFMGTPISEVDADRLSREIGWVNKHPYFISGTLRENLHLWEAPPDQNDLDAAIRDACLETVLAGYPEGLDMRLGAQALNLSGGQRQCVEIARALLHNPRLLVLDEATDGLDRETEQRLFDNLRRRGIAVLVVSHRAATLDTCDRVLYLRDGSVFDTPGHGTTETIAPSLDFFALDETHPEQAPKDFGKADEIAALFRRIADRTQGPLISPPEPPYETEDRIAQRELIALARRAGLILRPIRFAVRAWWNRDHGAMIAFLKDGRRPVAVVPHKSGRYLIYDPRTGLEQHMPDRPEDLLLEDAYAVYPRLRHGQVRTRDFFLHGASRVLPALRSVLVSDMLLVIVQATLPFAALYLFTELLPFGNAASGAFWLCGLGLYAVALLGIALMRSRAQNRFEGKLDQATHSALYQHLMRIRQHYVQSRAEDLYRSLQSLPDLLRIFRNGTLRRLTASLGVVTGTGAIAFVAPSAAALAMVLLLAAALLPLSFMHGTCARTRARIHARARCREFLRDMLLAQARLQQAGRTDAALAVWRDLVNEESTKADALRRADAQRETATEIAFWVAVLAFPVLAYPLVGSGGHFLTACLACFCASIGARNITLAVAALLAARPHLQRLDALATAPVDPVPLPDARTAATPRADTLDLQELVYGYPTQRSPVVRGGRLIVRPGEIVALTGAPGCGKSTLLRLILGFMDPDEGSISRGDFAPGDLSDWREHVGAVLQDDRLEAAQTIRCQIGGTEGYSLAEVREAARLAMLEDDIRDMPMGIQTIVDTERVSTGQKQRILIARRLIRKPAFLILDEATNALPEHVQGRLFENIRSLGITCLIVSHRASVLAATDRVYRMEDGTISATKWVESSLYPSPNVVGG